MIDINENSMNSEGGKRIARFNSTGLIFGADNIRDTFAGQNN